MATPPVAQEVLVELSRTAWLYRNRPDASWSGGSAAVTNHQLVQTLEANPGLREFVALGERIGETGMIKSAAGAASYLIEQANKRAKLSDWYDGITEGAGLAKTDPRLMFRKTTSKGDCRSSRRVGKSYEPNALRPQWLLRGPGRHWKPADIVGPGCGGVPWVGAAVAGDIDLPAVMPDVIGRARVPGQ